MRVKILGTSAAEGWPGIYCGCMSCVRARESGGKDIRSRASVLIDGIYKIDLPPDTFHHIATQGIDLSKLKYIFFTHSHGDHFAINELEYTRPSFAYNLKHAPIRIYANDKIVHCINARKKLHDLPLEVNQAKPFVPIQADHLTFIPIIANHSKTELCLNYVIKSDTAAVLYASDTGYYGDETLDFISKLKFDLLIVECTYGLKLIAGTSHMTFRRVLRLQKHLISAGAATPDTPLVLTHLSHNIGLLHDEIQERVSRKGAIVAYDGIEFEV